METPSKKEVREQNPNVVMFCQEGSFYTFYDMDALIVNLLCGYKIIPAGRRPKAGVPLSSMVLFTVFAREKIPYIVFKKGEGIIKAQEGSAEKYAEIVEQINWELCDRKITVATFFEEKPKVVSEEIKEAQRILRTLAGKVDPFTGEVFEGLGDEVAEWLLKFADSL
ncbi:MAG: hypothetical protein FWE38_01700 [Firmicutes bacterium]|nr:hypothetical protein [Bacillota bacterium]